MKNSKVHRRFLSLFFCQTSSLSRALLGIAVLLLEIRPSQEMSRFVLGLSAYTTFLAPLALLSTTTSATSLGSPEAGPGAPQFHSPQLRLTVKEGDRVLLPCKIHNLGDNHVIWRHKTNVLAGTNVSTYADQRIQLHSDLTLEIRGVTRDDEGEYECSITGAFSSRSGLVHSVIVHDAPTVSLITPTQMSVMEGESVEIGCIPHGKPKPRITWSVRDGQIAIPKGKLHQHRITLEKVTRSNAGLYVCSADNGVGRPAIGAVYVRVLYTPQVEIPKRRVHGGVGYKSQLACIVHADPPAEITWRIGKEPVELSERIYTETINNNEHNLVLNPVKDYDFKTYTCEANNSRGYDIRHIEFTGVPNPPIISRWETQILLKGTVDSESTSINDTQIHEEIHVTLFWVVECYSSLIDFRLHFRPDRRNVLKKKKQSESEDPWEELAIPADQSSAASFIHTKAFTLRDSSSARQQEFEGSLQMWKESVRHGGSSLPSKDEFAGFISNHGESVWSLASWKTCGILLASFVPVICKYFIVD